MASKAGDIDPVSEDFLDAIQFFRNQRSTEYLQGLLSDAAGESCMAVAHLSRNEADELYEDFNQLRNPMALEVRGQLSRKMFILHFPEVKQEFEERIAKLHTLADEVDEVHRNCAISNVVAASAGTVSDILNFLGLSLAPTTARGSLALMGTGAGLGLASAITSVLTSIAEHIENKAAKANAGHLVSLGINNEETTHDLKSQIGSLPNTCNKYVEDIRMNVRAYKQAKANPALVAKAEVLMSTGNISDESGDELQKAFTGTVLTMDQKTRKSNALGAAALILNDVVNLANVSKHLIDGPKAQLAEEMRKQARQLEKKLKELTWIYKTLKEEEWERHNDDFCTEMEDVMGTKNDMYKSVKANLKARQTLENKKGELASGAKALQQGTGDSEHKWRRAEAQLRELRRELDETRSMCSELADMLKTVVQEKSMSEHKLRNAEAQLQDLQERLEAREPGPRA